MTLRYTKKVKVQTDHRYQVMAARVGDENTAPIEVATAATEDWADVITDALNQMEKLTP